MEFYAVRIQEAVGGYLATYRNLPSDTQSVLLAAAGPTAGDRVELMFDATAVAVEEYFDKIIEAPLSVESLLYNTDPGVVAGKFLNFLSKLVKMHDQMDTASQYIVATALSGSDDDSADAIGPAHMQLMLRMVSLIDQRLHRQRAGPVTRGAKPKPEMTRLGEELLSIWYEQSGAKQTLSNNSVGMKAFFEQALKLIPLSVAVELKFKIGSGLTEASPGIPLRYQMQFSSHDARQAVGALDRARRKHRKNGNNSRFSD